jgi:hypothetical protein
VGYESFEKSSTSAGGGTDCQRRVPYWWRCGPNSHVLQCSPALLQISSRTTKLFLQAGRLLPESKSNNWICFRLGISFGKELIQKATFSAVVVKSGLVSNIPNDLYFFFMMTGACDGRCTISTAFSSDRDPRERRTNNR